MYLVIDFKKKKRRNYAYLVGGVGEGGRREVDGTGSKKKRRNYAYLVGGVGEGGRREVDGTGSGWFVVAAGGGEAQRVAPVDGG